MEDVASGAYAMYIEVLMSEMSTEEIAKLLDRSVEDVELMELQLLNAWIHEDTGDYFSDLPQGPEWLEQLICDRTDAMSRRMLKIWNKVLAEKLIR
ncbi:hypothetical protein E2P65_05555 [Candidatus Bathyarchaeota archaeon]|nr:hypothetical protein E2P65_05555 [Candidatus Bathyarchaeota archaeon]